ncbi:MAG: hypothetical protein U1E05_05585 [Patescibacteria group bacterium]|nr:hypothetical protein [Patescibacteria group bacterium]
MSRLSGIALLALLPLGCAPVDSWTATPGSAVPSALVAAQFSNPSHVAVSNHTLLWETVADVVDDYFPEFQYEEPVRLIGDTLTEGRLETYPQGSPTLMEPWRRDGVGAYEKLENTLQSMRRFAVVRVIPAQGGFLVDVAVYKELEDVRKPAHATAGAATLRYDDSIERVVDPVTDIPVHRGWIPKGRDHLVEQTILGHLYERLGVQAGSVVPTSSSPICAPG